MCPLISKSLNWHSSHHQKSQPVNENPHHSFLSKKFNLLYSKSDKSTSFNHLPLAKHQVNFGNQQWRRQKKPFLIGMYNLGGRYKMSQGNNTVWVCIRKYISRDATESRRGSIHEWVVSWGALRRWSLGRARSGRMSRLVHTQSRNSRGPEVTNQGQGAMDTHKGRKEDTERTGDCRRGWQG